MNHNISPYLPRAVGVLLLILGATFKIAPELEESGYGLPSWILSLQQLGLWFLLGGLLLAIATIFKSRTTLSQQALIFVLLFALYRLTLAITEYVHNGDIKYSLSLMVLIATLVVSSLWFANSNELGSFSLYTAIVIWSLLFAFLDGVLLLFYASDTVLAGRFYGLLGHPNFAGLAHAISCTLLLLGLLERWGNRPLLASMLVALPISASCLVASGSRTGILAAVVGVVYVLLSGGLGRIGLMMVALICGVTLFLGFAPLLDITIGDEILSGLTRIQTAENTRVDVWANMIDAFLGSPIIGVGISGADTAGSYLRAFAVGGLLVGLPMMMFMIVLIWICSISYSRSPIERVGAGICLVVATGSITEGTLLEAFSAPILLFAVGVGCLAQNALPRQERIASKHLETP